MTLPFRYQLQDVRKIHKFGGRALLGHEPGLGKSFISLLYIQRHPEVLPAVVVCPASAKYVWEREAVRHIGMRAEIIEGRTPPTKGLWQPGKLLVINYDILGSWLERLYQVNPNLVILDESQFLINPSANRTKAAKELCKGRPHILALSGTPLVNRPIELFPTLNILWPKDFHNRHAYGMKYAGGKRNFWGWEFKGATNSDELRNRLVSLGMIRRRKIDVLDQLPSKIRTIVPVDIDNRKEYNHAVKDFIGWLATKDVGKASRAAKSESMTKLGYLIRLVGEGKLESITQWIKDWLKSNDGKLILFGCHQKVLVPLHDSFRAISVLVDGGVTGRKRQQCFDQFKNRKTTRLFIGNIKAAGTAWSAKGASTVAFVELSWTPGEHRQAEDRAYGIQRGVKGEPTTCCYLVARDTIEMTILRVVQDKDKTISKVLDGTVKIKDGLDLHDIVIKELTQGNKE